MRGLEQIPWLYDALMAITDHSGLLRWRQKLASRSKGSVLEVGCGTGRNLPLYRVDSLVGCDPYLEVLLAARNKAPEIPLVVADAEALPFRQGSFDTVVSSLVFCSVPEPKRGLREILRMLRPGGCLLMMEHVRHEIPWRGRAQDFIQPLWTRLAGGCYPNRNTESVVREVGFEIDAQGRRARGTLRLFTARPSGRTPPKPLLDDI